MSPRWCRRYTAMVQIQYGSTPSWTLHLWWVENARLTLRTNCSEFIIVFFFFPLHINLLINKLVLCVPLVHLLSLFLSLHFCASRHPQSPNKSEFIRAKYQMLAFVHRLPCREDDSLTAKDLSKVSRKKYSLWHVLCVIVNIRLIGFFFTLFLFIQQLHSSVRTGNLETCLRLLSLGAQANFFHPVRFHLFI